MDHKILEVRGQQGREGGEMALGLFFENKKKY